MNENERVAKGNALRRTVLGSAYVDKPGLALRVTEGEIVDSEAFRAAERVIATYPAENA